MVCIGSTSYKVLSFKGRCGASSTDIENLGPHKSDSSTEIISYPGVLETRSRQVGSHLRRIQAPTTSWCSKLELFRWIISSASRMRRRLEMAHGCGSVGLPGGACHSGMAAQEFSWNTRIPPPSVVSNETTHNPPICCQPSEVLRPCRRPPPSSSHFLSAPDATRHGHCRVIRGLHTRARSV